MHDDRDLESRLREHGHRVTRPRRSVWHVLGEARAHLTAEQVATAARRHDPAVNLASIYRTLALFTELGLVRETNLGTDGGARWELAHPDDQFHLVCDSCGAVEHHGGTLVEQIKTHLGADHGFTASRVALSVSGQCARCAAARVAGTPPAGG